jgi:molybdenum cofactor biosynthesis enzyme MoaA
MITDQLPGLEKAFLHGIGEPLLNHELFEIIRHLKGRDVYVLFNSNGILLSSRRQQGLVRSGLDELRISLDASSAPGYQKMRDSDKFEKVVDYIRSSERYTFNVWYIFRMIPDMALPVIPRPFKVRLPNGRS